MLAANYKDSAQKLIPLSARIFCNKKFGRPHLKTPSPYDCGGFYERPLIQ